MTGSLFIEKSKKLQEYKEVPRQLFSIFKM